MAFWDGRGAAKENIRLFEPRRLGDVSVRSKKERVISASYDSVGFLRFDGDHDALDR
ncbi:hypothetical protein ABID37_004783, partial [Aquamicrobium terrae]